MRSIAPVARSRWHRLPAAIVTLALGGVLACAPAKQEVVFWQFWPAEVVQPLVEKFEQENPGLDVRMEQLTWQSGLEKITAAIASGNVPDLCELGSTWMPRMLASGQLSDWSAGVADLRPSLRGWELCSVGDAVYGMPWVMGTRALFYNKALFARAGLDSTRPPETWEELRTAAAAIQKLGGQVRGYGVQAGERYVLFKKFMPFAWGNGGRILSDDLTTAVFDSPANRGALEFYMGLREVGLLERQDMLDRAFKEGRLGLQISGGWLFKSIPKDAPTLRYGVALVPRPDREHGTHASFAGGEVLVSFNGARHKQAALQLARFLARPENALALAVSAESVQPATVGAETLAFYRERPAQQVMIRQFETAVPTPNHPAWVDMEAAIEDEVEQALYDRKTAARAVADAQQRLAELLGKHKR
jgi:multiple sugar transport system substrate-binding protein